MIKQAVLDESRCFVPWSYEMKPKRNVRLRIQIKSTRASSMAPPIGSWTFGPFEDTPDGIDVDLWLLDLHSITVKTPSAKHLAIDFYKDSSAGITERLTLEACWVMSEDRIQPIFQYRLRLPSKDFVVARKRFQESQTPPIQWFFIELTNRCNFHCAWCPKEMMTRPKGMMPLDQVKTLLDQIADYKGRHRLFYLHSEIRNPIFLHVMGEPLLYSHLFEALDYGHKLDLDFCLITNASLLTENNIHRLLASGIKSITVSLNVPDAESFTSTGAPISYSLLKQRIQHLVRERFLRRNTLPRIEIQLLNARNINLPVQCKLVEKPSQVEEQLLFWSNYLRELERETGSCHSQTDSVDQATHWQNVLQHEQNDEGIYFTLGQNIWLVVKRACNFANRLLPKHLAVQEAQQGVCAFWNAHRTFCVFWDGSSTFCSLDYDGEIQLGNVFEEGIEPIWSGEHMRQVRALMNNEMLAESICRRCLGKVRAISLS